MIKRNRKLGFFSLTVLLACLLGFWGCKSIKNENGWYYVADNQTKELSEKPFMTTGDIAKASVEKDEAGNKVILLKLKKEGIKKLEDATEAYKGKYIAFLCDDSIVSMVLVNEKISSEFIYVTNSDEELLLETYKTLECSIK